MNASSRVSHAKPARRDRCQLENGTVPPPRQLNSARRPREYLYLTPKEVELLRKAARERGRYGHRDATMVFIAYRHGLRPAELCALRWDQVDLAHGLLHVQRVKNGMPSVHPMGGSEIRDLRRLKREQPEGRHVFLTERSAPMTTAGFRKMLARAGAGGKFPFPVHPHMLRHACGYKLANDGQDTRAVQHSTTSVIKISSTRFATLSYHLNGSSRSGTINNADLEAWPASLIAVLYIRVVDSGSRFALRLTPRRH